MNKRIKIILILLTLSVTLSFMSHTYSRYVADATGNIELNFAKWQILINDEDITSGTTTDLNVTPVIEASNNVKENKLAPSSKGYFDILVNPTNVEMSFDYKIKVEILNDNMPDILITKYAILPSSYKEGNTITTNKIENEEITGTLKFDTKTKDFAFEPFTVRIYFEWFEGANENMDDEADTQLAINANKNNTKLQIKASLEFSQNLNETTTEEKTEEEPTETNPEKEEPVEQEPNEENGTE